jgi:acetoin utilization deacetylase AcuC-like enzyme
MNKAFVVASDEFLAHQTGKTHPEQPQRYTAIMDALKKNGLIDAQHILTPREATNEELALCHDPYYIRLVQNEVEQTKNRWLGKVAMLSTGDVTISPESYHVALLAAGGVLTAVDAVMSGKAKTIFCVVRPPGHHARRAQGMGFCLFNNVAVGVRYLQKKYGIKKVAIIDWDVHHGNGTQDIFYDDPNVFYFSTHQYPFYPGTGLVDEKGFNQGQGTTLNCPISSGENSREEIFDAFKNQLVPALDAFKPEFIFISAGFDSHYADPIGSFNLKEDDFAELTRIVVQLADKYAKGRIVSVLEGGYHLEAIARSAVNHVKALI